MIIGMESFIIEPFLATFALAAVCGPLGCLMVWQRLVFFSDALAHVAFLGGVISFIFKMHFFVGVIITSLTGSLWLSGIFLNNLKELKLNLLTQISMALGIALLSKSKITVDVNSFLFGDVLAISHMEFLISIIVAITVGLLLYLLWDKMIMASISEEIAMAEGKKPIATKRVFLLLIGIVVGIASYIMGPILVTGLLILPVVISNVFAKNPAHMVIFSSLTGMLNVLVGFYLAFSFNLPISSSITIAGMILYLFCAIFWGGVFKKLINKR